MQHECLPSTGLMFTESEMLELAAPQTSRPLISFAAASPAKILAALDSAPVSKEVDLDFGLSSLGLLANYDHDTRSWRMFQISLAGDLELYSEIWSRSGTMRNGIVSRLPPLARLTDAIESSLLPTPRATDWKNPRGKTGNRSAASAYRAGWTLYEALGGTPNPQFVEWLMGFPLGWTELED
jgi:hypothetical protein